VPKTSLWSRLFNVIAAPGDVFDEVKASPPSNANWLTPALLFMVVAWLGGWLVLSQDFTKQQIADLQEKAVQKQVEKGKITKDQAEAMRAGMERYDRIGQTIGTAVAPPFMAFASPFWFGLVVWLLGAKLFKGHFDYMKGVEVAGLVGMIAVLESVLRTLLIMVFGNVFAGPHAGMIFGSGYDATNPLHTLLAKVDLMTFWELAVLSLGLARLAGVSFGKAVASLGGLWVLWTALISGIGWLIKLLTGT
jgi:hypothetical protein